MNGQVPKRISTAILHSVGAGVVPRIGLESIAVGRKQEVEIILRDLEAVSEGASVFRLVSGEYGSGKSFLLQMIRNYAMDKNFIVADVDLSPEKRLTGSRHQGMATYRELTQRLSTKVRPEGGALEAILQKWINEVRRRVIRQTGLAPDAKELGPLMEREILQTSAKLEDYAHGYDFGLMLALYYRSFVNEDAQLRQGTVKWFRGEYATKTEAKAILPVGEIITDENWYAYLKLLAVFATQLGYEGLVLFVDECANLAGIANRHSRENNYEKLLTIFNDTMQGRTAHLGAYFAGTPRFIEDEQKGLFSYAALKSRLMDNRFVRDGYLDFSSPIIRLNSLTYEELYILMERLTEIHAAHYGYQAHITKKQILSFMEIVFHSSHMKAVTTREITRDYIGLLNILLHNPNTSFESMIYTEDFNPAMLHPIENAQEPL